MIYTFYSYKGGVGRSMALANVAECFYLQGLRVLMIDWDLEAPGLENFFFEPGAEDPTASDDTAATGKPPALEGVAMVQSKLGLIDMLTEYKRSYSSILPQQERAGALVVPKAFRDFFAEEAAQSPAGADEFTAALNQHLPPLSTYLVPLHVATTDPSSGASPAASLSLLPAGWRYKERFQAYGQAVQSFDWDGFYASYRAKDYFNWLSGKLLEAADVVLIDSRTGVTEMGGVCARQMADCVVSFSAPNNQNLDGIARMNNSFKRPETIEARDQRKLDTVIVPTRLDPAELKELKKFQARFERLVDDEHNAPQQFKDLKRTFWELQIPYRALYSYQERRVIGPDVTSVDPTKGLENAYWKLASHLALLAPETHAVRRRFAALLQREFPALLPKVVLSYMADAVEAAADIQSYLRSAGIQLWPDLRHESESDDLQSSTGVISQTTHFVVVLSERAQADSGIIRRELRFARQQGKTTHVLLPPGERLARPWLQPAESYTNREDLLERLRTTPRALRVPVMAPVVAPGYVERPAAQQELKANLMEAAKSTGRPVMAVWGQGGSGKTALMARLCQDEDIVDTYTGGIFFVNASEAAAPSRIVTAISGETSVLDASVALSTAASLLRGRRFLLVIDDVWTDKEIAPLLTLAEPCAIFLLTRDLNLATSLAGKVMTLDMLTPQEAATFLPGAAGIADQLGRWPLALSLVRTALQQEGTLRRSDADALESVSTRLGRHGIVAFDRPGTERKQSLARSIGGEEHTAGSDAAGTERNESVARSIEYTLSHLQNWERKRFEQLAALCAIAGTTFQHIRKEWLASPPGVGEPSRPLKDQQMEALCQRFSELSLIAWEPKSQTISLNALIHDYLRTQGILGQAEAGTVTARVSSGKDRKSNEDVDRARRVLGGVEISFDDLTALAKRLKTARYFSYARQLFSRARRLPEAAPRRVFLAQQHALCTYKDPDLPSSERADRALEILAEADDLNQTTDQETLGLAGAIFKYRWASDGQRLNLERSLAYYLRGYNAGVEKDYGYTGINAAFVLDQIAFQERIASKKAGLEALTTVARRQQAREIREDIAAHLPGLARGNEWLEKQWWFLVTIAEAFFGLQRYEEARYWLREALAIEVAGWEFETTARQFARLAILQNEGEMPAEDSDAYHTLRVFLGNDIVALRSIALGKVGLALSGGGFRASLFHIGVLARLAELDMLRHVEVLSCVSGGSIIGAHYYLEVKRLLEQKADAEIKADDYVELVKRLESDFLQGVQANLRTRLAANPWINLKTLLLPHYTRTDRLGELFEKQLYSRVTGNRNLFLSDLLVLPKDAPADFAPKLDNWHRAAKVPMLILNATTLNTGHNWQFTATWMGEPPAGVGAEIDGNDLLRRMYYWEAPKDHQTIRLGRAVAASACVPGLFDPIEFQNLYPKRTIRLVDGGVHDNQGVGGLLEQECSVLLVSDASGQMSSQSHPGAEPFQVPLRASSILGARVREAQFLDLESRRRSSQIKSLMFVHLKKDLDTDPVNWVDCADPYELSDDARPKERRGPLTRYGILKTVQERLSAVRTDLDSFTDAEAFALMLSGYRMTEHEFAACVEGVPASNVPGDWRFLSLEKAMNRAKDFEDAHDDLMGILKAGSSRAFKIWQLSGGLQVFGVLLLVVFAASLVAFWPGLGPVLVFAGRAALIAILFLAAPIPLWAIFRVAGVKKPFLQLVSGLFLGLAGWTAAWLHLWLIDPGFLAWGKVSRVEVTLPAPEDRQVPQWRQFSGVEGKAAWFRPLLMFVLVLVILGPQIPIGMARLAQTRGDFASARDNWSRVLSVTEVREAYLGRAWANRELGDYPSAIADYGRAISSGANRSSIWRDRAYAFLKAGDYKSAIADYDRLPTGAIDARIRAERDFAQTMLNPPPYREPAPRNAPSPRSNVQLVILYLNESKQPKADEIASFLTTHLGYSRITVMPYKSQITGFNFVDPNELHYFSPGDRTVAYTIVESLGRNMIAITPRFMRVANERPGYFEIWLRDQ